LWDQALATNILAKKNQLNYQNQEINIFSNTRARALLAISKENI
jgi:hypothetical protein